MGRIYQNIPFVSEVDAIWAAFFDEMRIKWAYKEEAIAGRDAFFLPELHCWILIISEPLTESFLSLVEKEGNRSDNALAVFSNLKGLDYGGMGRLFCSDISDSSAGESAYDCCICNGLNGEFTFGVLDYRLNREYFADSLFHHELPTYPQVPGPEAYFPNVRIEIAFDAAKATIKKTVKPAPAAFQAYKQAQAILKKRAQEAQERKGMVKLYKDGDSFAIVTDCQDERDFIQEFSEAIDVLIGKGQFLSIVENEGIATDWAFQLNGWLPQFIDLCCKYRGYKSSVQEKRVLSVGGFWNEAVSPIYRNDIRPESPTEQSNGVSSETKLN